MLALGEVLDLPFRERNRLLEAGFARVLRERPLSPDEMARMRGMLKFILDQHLNEDRTVKEAPMSSA
jgi:hypothetical protein